MLVAVMTLLSTARSAYSRGVVSCTYHQWFQFYSNHRRYCQLPAHAAFSEVQAGLPFTGSMLHRQHAAQHVDRTHSVCSHCGGQSIEDELPMFLNAPCFAPLRQQHSSFLMSDTDTRQFFFGQQDHMQVFSYILSCLDLLEV